MLARNAYGAVFDFNCNRFWHKQKKRMCESMIKNCWNRGAISGVFLNIRSFSGWFFQTPGRTHHFDSLFICLLQGWEKMDEEVRRWMPRSILARRGAILLNNSPPKCASKLKSHEHIQNTNPPHFWNGIRCLLYDTKVQEVWHEKNYIFDSLWNLM